MRFLPARNVLCCTTLIAGSLLVGCDEPIEPPPEALTCNAAIPINGKCITGPRGHLQVCELASLPEPFSPALGNVTLSAQVFVIEEAGNDDGDASEADESEGGDEHDHDSDAVDVGKPRANDSHI